MGNKQRAAQGAVAFHRQTVERLKKELEGVDRNSRGRYIRDFQRAFRSYRDLSSHDDLVLACSKADLVLIGDYHALPASQQFAARLLDAIAPRSGRTVLAMEMVFGRHQRVLDRWLAGDLEEGEFLTRIRYRQEWGYPWEGFREVFRVARERGVPVVGIDCEPRDGLRFIRRRDRYAAERIADIFARRPGTQVVVLIGESHLAPGHLPERVREALARRGLRGRAVTVLQNIEGIYWKLAEEGHERAEVVALGEDRFCVFHSSPLAKYEAYRQTIERWKSDGADGDQADLTPTIYRMIDTLLRFLRVDKYATCVNHEGVCIEFLVDVYPEVYGVEDLGVFRRLLLRGGVSRPETARIVERARDHGSFYVPRVNAILVGEFNLVHGGEEAAHFVNAGLKGEILDRADSRRRPRHDRFYTAVIEEALGFFGSKLFVPGRNHFFETDIYRFYRKDPETIAKRTPYTREELDAIVHFVLLHKKFEVGYRDYDRVPPELLAGIHSTGARFRILTHELGYYLGQQIYDGLERGILDQEEISRLFAEPFRETGSALRRYLDLTEKLESVRE
ncbi:MAG: ChaN family lipoprotein [Acidobacteria bacterium]|nr:ChaN family lipoprotein [Acidobacteriota bacterium]